MTMSDARLSHTEMDFTLTVIAITALIATQLAHASATSSNPIDNCWRGDARWASNRKKLAACAVGFGSHARGGTDGEIYVVSSPNDDDPTNPKPGTLRYAVTRMRALWVVFSRSMNITLKMPLYVTRHKTIDGRGATVHISNGSCIRIFNVSNVIVHGMYIHDCLPNSPGYVLTSEESGVAELIERQDGDAISVVASTNVWIDHNCMWACDDGLVDVTLASTNVTISNCRFHSHNKVMLLGHSDDYSADTVMNVTVAYNHFGPNLMQRMPRARFGFVHVVNNDYEPWGIYAIGGSSDPVIRSEGNRFVAPDEDYKKQVTWKEYCDNSSSSTSACSSWLWKSVSDVFENGAYFVSSGKGKALPLYMLEGLVSSLFRVGRGSLVPKMTGDAGPLSCTPSLPCL